MPKSEQREMSATMNKKQQTLDKEIQGHRYPVLGDG